MIIEIKGVQFVNKGAELMLQAVLQQVEQRWPDAEIALAPNGNSPYLLRAKIGAWQKLNIRKRLIDLSELSYRIPDSIRGKLRHFGIVTEADVDLILDASGFAYGDQWPDDTLIRVSKEVERFHKHNKPYVFLSQAFGPFTSDVAKTTFAQALSQAALVVARDKVSEQHLKGIMASTDNLVRFPDFTNLVTSTQVDDRPVDKKTLLIIPNYNMVYKRNRRLDWKEGYIDLLKQVASQASEAGWKLCLLNHEGPKDEAICLQLQKELGDQVPVIYEQDSLRVKGVINAAGAVISSRFHGCVSALCQGIPCIGTSWSHKYEELYDEYNQLSMLLTECDLEAAKEMTERLLSPEWQQQCESNKNINELKQASEAMWQRVTQAVKR